MYRIIQHSGPCGCAIVVSLVALVDCSREVLVLYLERPQRTSAQLHALRGALLIQRLEGSRPHGRLCTLNRSERVQGDQAPAELGRMCGFDGAIVR